MTSGSACIIKTHCAALVKETIGQTLQARGPNVMMRIGMLASSSFDPRYMKSMNRKLTDSDDAGGAALCRFIVPAPVHADFAPRPEKDVT